MIGWQGTFLEGGGSEHWKPNDPMTRITIEYFEARHQQQAGDYGWA